MMKSQMNQPFILGSDQEIQEVGGGIARQVLGYNNNMMMVKVLFEEGAIGYMHQHPHVQASYVLSGVFEVTVGDKTRQLQAGDSFFVPPQVMHGCKCLNQGAIIDTFNPMREDFVRST